MNHDETISRVRQERRAILLAGARAELERLQAAKSAGWNVDDDIANARAYVETFSR